MSELFGFSVTTFVAVFFVVDPFAAIPLLLSMTERSTQEQRNATARKASITMGVVLLGFALAGGVIFRLFGISIATFRVAGGILLFLMALDMMRATRSTTRTTDEEVAEGIDKPDVGIVPLGVPMLAGPGAMSTVTVLMRTAGDSALRMTIVGVCVLLTAALTFVTLMTAQRLRAVLKTTGLNVLNRVMGLVLAAVAVQFVSTGLLEIFPILGMKAGTAGM